MRWKGHTYTPNARIPEMGLDNFLVSRVLWVSGCRLHRHQCGGTFPECSYRSRVTTAAGPASRSTCSGCGRVSKFKMGRGSNLPLENAPAGFLRDNIKTARPKAAGKDRA